MPDAPRADRAPRLALLAILFTASGASGLVFEVVWVKSLTLIIGHTTFAVSVVVSAFLGGLALGSAYFGRRADRVRDPLVAYAVLEVVTGVLALAVTASLQQLDGWLGAVGLPGGGPLALRVLLVFALILPPTFAMGGTLPMLVRFATRDLETLGRRFALLYSLNTLGAAVGCALAGFLLIGWLGLFATAACAAGLNFAIAGVVWAGWKGRPSTLGLRPDAQGARGGSLRGSERWLVAVFALCGAGSISYEVLWFRILASSLDSTTYALTVLLVTFLLGLVLGGLLYARLGLRSRPLEQLAGIQAMLALAGVISLALLGQVRPLGRGAEGLLQPAGGHLAAYLAMLFQASAIILVPATLIGLVFPLVAQLATGRLDRVGRSVGTLYAANTLGGIAGSLLMGFALVPALGTQGSYALVCALNLAIALGVNALDGEAPARLRRNLIVAAVLLAGCFAILPPQYLVNAQVGFPDSRLVQAREGRDGTLAVLEYDRDSVCRSGAYACDESCPEFRHRKLVFGSISYASTVLPAKRYMRTLAHLPMLLHERPERVLEICFGTGTTAGAFTTHPSLGRLTVVDINPDVFAVAPDFAEANLGVASSCRARLIVDDGRHFLAANPETFEIISLEPPPPTAEGAVNLYSREFYASVKRRLAPGGILAQWIPMEQQSDLLDRMLVSSILAEFPQASLWMPSRTHAIVLASDRPLTIDLQRWQDRWRAPAVGKNLAEAGFAAPIQLAATFVMGTAPLREYVREVPPVTDDRPAAEHFLMFSERRFSLDALFRGAEDPARYLAGAAPQRLADQVRASRLFAAASAASFDGDREAAREAVERARAIAGPSAYSDYLLRMEYGCLAPK